MDIDSTVAAYMVGSVVLLLIILIPILVVYIIGRWKMFQKAGKAGWESIIPFYSDWVYTEIAGVEWWWFIALIITSLGVFSGNSDSNSSINVNINLGSLIGLVGSFVCNYNISKKLHKDTGFAVLMTIFPVVLITMIGFSSKYSWDKDVPVTKNGPFDANKESSSVKEEVKEEKTTEEKKEDKKEKDATFCSHCGAEIEKGSKFCSKCGKEI